MTLLSGEDFVMHNTTVVRVGWLFACFFLGMPALLQ
jgi:hypothetical protein